MAKKNKIVRRRTTQSDRYADPSLMEEMEEATPAQLQAKARKIQRNMTRLKVEMTADRLGFPMGRQEKMTYAQAAEKRRTFFMQAAEFIITAVLLVGGCAWLYQWWLSRQ